MAVGLLLLTVACSSVLLAFGLFFFLREGAGSRAKMPVGMPKRLGLGGDCLMTGIFYRASYWVQNPFSKTALGDASTESPPSNGREKLNQGSQSPLLFFKTLFLSQSKTQLVNDRVF
jgi:hypothetical protein